MRHRPLFIAFGSAAGASFLALASCSTGADGAPPGSELDNGGSGGSGASSTEIGGTSSGGSGGGPSIQSGGNGAGGIEACQDQSEPARLTPVNIVFMIDKSGSMGIQDVNGDGIIDDGPNEWDHSAERWIPVSDALVAFFENPGAEGLAASLEFFPNGGQPTAPDTGVCSVSQYASPSVPLKLLDDPAESALLVSKIRSTVPGGGTPTLPALQGALQYAAKLMTDNPGSKSVVVFVTDGAPGVARLDESTGEIFNEKCFCYGQPGCPDEDEIPYVAQAALDAATNQGIMTYVIGMGEVEPGNLDLIAASGGTNQAFIVSLDDPAQTQAEFSAALGSVRSVQAPCEIQMPAPPAGESFDKLKVNVEFQPGQGAAVPLYYAGSLATRLGGSQLSCPEPTSANPWFWTYDSEESPTQIILCPSACAQTAGDAAGKVNVKYGCKTQVSIR